MDKTSESTNRWVAYVTVLILVLFSGSILMAVIFNARVLVQFRDQLFARGLITFIVIIATIGIAFMMVLQAFFGSFDAQDERFRRGREVFTGLMGVLGTIVGFYFGSGNPPVAKMHVADIQVFKVSDEVRRLSTYISGGIPPYRYSVKFEAADDKSGEAAPKNIENKISNNGWINEEFKVVGDSSVTIEASDKNETKETIRAEVKMGDRQAEAAK